MDNKRMDFFNELEKKELKFRGSSVSRLTDGFPRFLSMNRVSVYLEKLGLENQACAMHYLERMSALSVILRHVPGIQKKL